MVRAGGWVLLSRREPVLGPCKVEAAEVLTDNAERRPRDLRQECQLHAAKQWEACQPRDNRNLDLNIKYTDTDAGNTGVAQQCSQRMIIRV
jgi:hypothetical protein